VKQQCKSEQFIIINDNLKRLARDFYIKWKEGEREQDSRETERESVCERQSVAGRER
jgi:hypothetical protein